MIRTVVLASALWAASMGFATAHEQCNRDDDVTLAVRAAASGIVLADNARDADRVLSFYAPDAVLMPPNEEPVTGVTAIRPRYEQLFTNFDPAIETRIDEVCVSHDIAFVRGRNGGQLKGRGSNPSRTLDDTYFMVLHTDDQGKWKITHLIWHPSRRA